MRFARVASLAFAASVALLCTGCTNVDGTSDASGRVCPEQLPVPEGGAEAPRDFAGELPDLPAADAAWLCQYTADVLEATTGDEPGGDQAWEWSREGEPAEISVARLDVVDALTSGLVAFPEDVACTLELGPRWLVVLEADEELFGVAVDDYGCHEARLTDDPFEVAPGHSDDPRLPRGRLMPPTGVVDELKAVAGVA